MKTDKTDVYTRVTNRIIESLEAGTRPWVKPWSAPKDDTLPLLPLRGNGVAYRGINILLLWGEAIDKGFTCNTWMTYKQAEERGAHIRKGEKGSTVVYANKATKTELDATGEELEREFGFLKSYTVFNAEQIEGLPEAFYVKPALRDDAEMPQVIDAAEQFFAGTGAEFRHGGNRAFYRVAGDFIQLPPVKAFRDAESYTATKAHELIHWTGAIGRMDREFGKRFGDKAYAFEELVAELGSAFLCAALGLVPERREDHAAYLATWLAVLKQDKRAIFLAASHAQRAADFLHGLQTKDEPIEEEERIAAMA